MKTLIACEESQTICKAFREKGHEAYSNDIVKCSGGVPEWHILQDAKSVINGGIMRLQTGRKIKIDRWDLIIAHPPCTYLSNVATRHHSLKMSPANWINGRTHNRIDAMNFFMMMVEANCERIAVENPIGIMNSAYRKPDQIIHPYFFAESVDDADNYHMKATCLWLKGLPLLKRTSDLPEAKINKFYPSGKRKTWEDSYSRDASVRSKTFPGIAKAMAEQWG